MRLGWSDRARRDLREIYAHIAVDNPAAARRWVGRLQERARAATSAPLAGRVVPELDDSTVREVFLQTYRIVYRVAGDELHVLTVFEGHKLLVSPGLADESETDVGG